MATIQGSGSMSNDGFFTHSWDAITEADLGSAAQSGRFPDKSVQALGTFGTGGTVAMEGSNDGGTTWFALNDPLGTPIALVTSAPGAAILENPGLIRPNISAGTGVSLNVRLVMRTNT